ncbi:HNH endonuclease [uncultured Massilia sp.]|uniref:HNH endonuclease n=1 Tax=uncultured Massilia sp. TaxID=169973 RepID=UPI0025E37BFD|nr:HNH endonuclease domain-containing protein [uncultured Massilia sp.]
MLPPSPQEQLVFLDHIQRLFEEGEFVATYKYALLLAITELAVELGTDTGGTLDLFHADIANKFLELYWRQVVPYRAQGEDGILVQNKGKQAAIIGLLRGLHARHGTLSKARASGEWKVAVRETVGLLKTMPLWRLQVLRRQEVRFLYIPGTGPYIRLLPGVMFNLRRFHGLLQQLIRSAWTAHIRTNPRNIALLGEGHDLEEVLFGSDRASLALVRPVLRDLQDDTCFYCQRRLGETGDVDHFIPWSRYPRDLGHNFVLAHRSCNGDKRDLLPATVHLEKWRNRNVLQGAILERELAGQFICDEPTTLRVAQWSYEHGFATSSQSWLGIKDVVPLTGDYRRILAQRVAASIGPPPMTGSGPLP